VVQVAEQESLLGLQETARASLALIGHEHGHVADGLRSTGRKVVDLFWIGISREDSHQLLRSHLQPIQPDICELVQPGRGCMQY
jgi:hypothetical protein